jgi:hypothetical protein
MPHATVPSPASSSHATATLQDCPNCGHALPALTPPAHYCAHCGQEATLHPPSVREFLHEFIGHYVALEGALWKTLALLVLRPGRLTSEYLAGRRRRYVLPLRLYLTASFLFFVAVRFVPAVHDEVMPRDAKSIAVSGAHPASAADFGIVLGDDAAAASSTASTTHTRHPLSDCLADDPRCGRFERTLASVMARWRAHPQETNEHFQHLLQSLAPYAVFLMLPVFAAFTMLAYRRRRMLYGEHLVFALHLHSFWFLALLLLALLPDAVGGWGLLALIGYALWAMRAVYRGRWGPTLLRAALVGVLYSVALSLGSAALILGSVMMA